MTASSTASEGGICMHDHRFRLISMQYLVSEAMCFLSFSSTVGSDFASGSVGGVWAPVMDFWLWAIRDREMLFGGSKR